jgi:hypothetical protein
MHRELTRILTKALEDSSFKRNQMLLEFGQMYELKIKDFREWGTASTLQSTTSCG